MAKNTELRTLEDALEKLRNEESVIERHIDEYFAILRKEPYSRDRLTKKIEYADKEKERIKKEIIKVSADINRLHENVSYPDKNAYNYKKYSFKCKKCDWEGLGVETVIVGDVINFEVIGCPKCRELIEFISFPSTSDILKYETAEDKRKAQGWLKENEKIKEKWDKNWQRHPDLTTPDQLPDISTDEIIITLREEGIGKINTTGDIWEGAFLVFYCGEQELWRVPAWFEYYTGYLKWGEILKEKYGERLIDFEAEYTVDLGGDSSSAFNKVREFRKSLSKK